MKNKGKWFNPHSSFLSLKILWVVVSIHIILAILISLTIAYNSNLAINLNYIGVNFFVEIFKVPLAILALIIPMVALLAANHRSVQTKEQIQITSEQNVFSNHYKHLEEFEKYCTSIFDHDADKILKPRQLHAKIFCNSKMGNHVVSSEFSDDTTQFIDTWLKLSEDLNTTNQETWKPAVIKLIKKNDNFNKSHFLEVKTSITRGCNLTHDSQMAIAQNCDVRQVIVHFVKTLKLLTEAMSFDSDYETPPLTKKVCEVDLSKIPNSSIENLHKYVSIDFKSIAGISEHEIQTP